MLISATLKCPTCGNTRKQIINTDAPEWKDQQEQMRAGKKILDSACSACWGKPE